MVTLVSVVGVPTAQAGQNIVSLTGSGTIDPGLPCPATGCDVDFSGEIVIAGQDASGTGACTFDGRDTHPGGATVASGSGVGTIYCQWNGGTVSGPGNFARQGTTERVSGTVTLNGGSAFVDLTCEWAPGGPPPVTTYTKQCAGTLTTG